MSVKQLKVAIIQLARSGDVLQTTEAIREIKNRATNVQFYLISRASFAKQLEFATKEVFEDIFYIDLRSIFEKKFEGPINLNGVLHNIRGLTGKINSLGLDFVVNLNFSKSSAYLCSILKSKYKNGLSYDKTAQIKLTDRWSQYFYSTVLRGPNNPFHVVDLFRNIVSDQKNGTIQKGQANVSDSNIITIHPFASHAKKAWGLNKWAESITLINKIYPDYKFVILGGEADKNEALSIKSNSRVAADVISISVGQSSVEDSYHIIKKSCLFIGHDSLCSHLAAMAGVQTITLAMGTVRPQETFPYIPGAVVVSPKDSCFPCTMQTSCDNHSCHQSISQTIIATLACNVLRHKGSKNIDEISGHLLPGQFSNCDVSTVESFDFGLMLRPSALNGPSLANVIQSTYRVLWSFVLNGAETNSSVPIVDKNILDQLKNFTIGLEMFYELNGFGEKFTKYLLDDIAKSKLDSSVLNKHTEKIKEVDQLSFNLGDRFPLLAPLIDYYHLRKNQLVEQNLESITRSLCVIYQEAAAVTSAKYELINSIINNNGPSSKDPSKDQSV